jgi:hypothetical protein
MATLQDVPALLNRAIRTGTNLHLTGEPGIGKTSVIEQCVQKIRDTDKDFWFDTIYTPSLSPIYFVAMIPDHETESLKAYKNDKLPNAFDTPDMRGVLFLGERDNADPATNKALQKYINNEDMGGLRKPVGVIVVSDSNDVSHRSGAVQQSLALLSRSRVVSVDVDPNVTLKHFGNIGVHPMVQAYLSLRKEHVSTFDKLMASREYKVWANPRSWVRVSDGLADAEAYGEKLSAEEIIGDVGEGVGREFTAFLHAAMNLVSYDEIVANPKAATKPENLSDVYAIVAMLSATVKSEHMDAVKTYVSRWNLEVQILFLRLLTSSQGSHAKTASQTSAYRDWVTEKDIRTALLSG